MTDSPASTIPGLPEDPAARAILQDIAVRLLATPEDNYLGEFVAAAGEAMRADMVLVSRIHSPDKPVEAYAIWDRNGQATEYRYPLSGTPCEQVFVNQRPYVSTQGLQAAFPDDRDLAAFDLHAYVGMPLLRNGECVGLIAALWTDIDCDPETCLDVFRHVENRLLNCIERQDARCAAQAHLEYTLELTRHHLALALEASEIGVWDYDLDTHCFSMDDRIREIYGQTETEPGASRSSSSWLLAVHPDDRARLDEEMRTTVENRTSFSSQFRIITPKGEVRTVRSAGRFAAGSKIMGCTWDVSGDIALQAELDTRRNEAEQANAAKTRFLANMSHEIRTPLNGILGMAQLLDRTNLDERQRFYLATLNTSGRSLVGLIDELLDIAQIESGEMKLARQVFHLGDFARATAEMVQHSVRHKSLEFDIAIDPALETGICSDEKRLRQVLLNLLANAVKFTQEGRVGLTLRAGEGDRVHFEITDTGPGIAPDQQAGIFDRFAQADASNTRAHGGAGLGLAISREIVAIAGGEMGLRSAEGEGSTFWFELPLERHEAAAAVTGPEPECLTDERAGTKRILVVEDIETNREITLGMLKSAGFETGLAVNGADALHRLSAETYDAVLMDIHMPVMPGDEAIRRIRASGKAYSDIPIFALTADATPQAESRLLKLGADGYFSKPINMGLVIRALERALFETPTDRADQHANSRHRR